MSRIAVGGVLLIVAMNPPTAIRVAEDGVGYLFPCRKGAKSTGVPLKALYIQNLTPTASRAPPVRSPARSA